MNVEYLIVWIISCLIALLGFAVGGYFLRKIKIKFLPIFIIVEFLATGFIVYGFMMIFTFTPSIVVALQPLFLAAFIVSIITGVIWIFCKIASIKKFDKIKVYFWKFGNVVTVFLGAMILIYGFLNVQNVRQVDYEVKSSKIKSQYSLVVLSDVHYGDGQLVNNLQKAADKISQVNPDYLLICGDLVDDFTTKTQMSEVVTILSSIDTKNGKFFVNGNHELIASSMVESDEEKFTLQDFHKCLSEHNINVINDKLVHAESDLAIIGKEDNGSDSRVNEDFFSSQINNNEFKLCLEHEPETWDVNSDYGIDLQVSGHNHYGQLFPLGLIGELLGVYVYGAYDNSQSTLIVSSGFGSWEYPIRTGNHCEYLYINLMPE